MTDQDFNHLELLLEKLSKVFPGNKICIIPQYIQDGAHVGLYNYKGDLVKSTTKADLKSCVEDLISTKN